MDEAKGVSRMTEDQKTATVEMEGGGWTWYYVCSECHGAIDTKDKVCPHCKSVISWEGVFLK